MNTVKNIAINIAFTLVGFAGTLIGKALSIVISLMIEQQSAKPRRPYYYA